MKEELIKLFKLKPDTDEAFIVECVKGVMAEASDLRKQNGLLSDENQLLQELNVEKPESNVAKLEKRIAQKISQSGGALNREQAVMAIAYQDEHGNQKKTAKK